MADFTVLPEHLILLGALYVDWDDQGYWGAPAVSMKRPYGNSYVVGDLYELLKEYYPLPEATDEEDYEDVRLERHIESLHEELLKLHRGMGTVMQITITLAARGELIQPGLYRTTESYSSRSWELVEPTFKHRAAPLGG